MPRTWFFSVPSLLFVGAALLTGCSRSGIDTSEVVRPVRVLELQRGENTLTESFPAQIEARHQADLGFQVGGRIIQREVELGERVAAGQVLFSLDPQDLRLAQNAAQAQQDAAQAELAQLQIEYQRAQTLKEENFISQAEVERRKLAVDAAAARLQQAKAQLDAQRNQTRYASLRAPAAGVVTALYGDAGQVVAAGQPVLRWADESSLQARIAMPERAFGAVKTGQSATVQVWAVAQQGVQATVRELAQSADNQTRSFEVILDLTSPSPQVRPGMSATVTFESQLEGQAFRLPLSALVAEPTGAYVWVFDEAQGKVNRRPVQPHDVSESSFLVKDNLRDGELIVTAGTHVLNEGQAARRFVEATDLMRTPTGQQP